MSDSQVFSSEVLLCKLSTVDYPLWCISAHAHSNYRLLHTVPVLGQCILVQLIQGIESNFFIHYTVFTVMCTLYTVHCTPYSV